MSHLFGDHFITLKYLRRWPDSKRAVSWKGTPVHIRTENGIWRPDAHGYTNHTCTAWVLPFEDAIRQVAHTGPEKRAAFLRARATPCHEISIDDIMASLSDQETGTPMLRQNGKILYVSRTEETFGQETSCPQLLFGWGDGEATAPRMRAARAFDVIDSVILRALDAGAAPIRLKI